LRKNVLNLAMMSTLAAFTTVVHADITVAPGAFTTSVTTDSVTLSFTSATWAGFSFSQIGGGVAGPVFGTLTGVSVDATLEASAGYAYADDLTIYVDVLPLSTGGLLQVGGFSSLSAAERHSWANGASSSPGTTVIDTVTLTTPLTFTGATNPVIWLGNGYGASGSSGTWSGSITLIGLSTTAPVPEPESWALFAVGAAGLVGWMSRRRRPTSVAR
jgi:hypothetical protein